MTLPGTLRQTTGDGSASCLRAPHRQLTDARSVGADFIVQHDRHRRPDAAVHRTQSDGRFIIFSSPPIPRCRNPAQSFADSLYNSTAPPDESNDFVVNTTGSQNQQRRFGEPARRRPVLVTWDLG
jgi:hypothetical protein